MDGDSQLRTYIRSEVIVFRMTIGEFGALSNMAPDFPLMIEGTRVSTVEALYQACRFPDRSDIQAIIVDQPSPMTAKMKSKKFRDLTRSDWDRRRLGIMRWCLQVKLAQNWSKFGAVLEKTESRPIVEESRRDDFWGAKPNDDGTLVGLNVLGRLLMQLREDYCSPNNERLKSVDRPNIPNFMFLGKNIGLVTAPASVNYTEPVQPSFLSR
jgi:ribA/ribD-fused uncharacterized protein